MKTLIFLFCILCSLASFADSTIRYASEDFDLFPLTTSNAQLIEGIWIGESVVIKIEEMNHTFDNRLYMWVEIASKNTVEEKSALLYYNTEHDTYELYVFDSGISVPLEIMIFKYSSKIASERRMKCSNGGYVMKLGFSLDENESQTVQLQRETCSDQ